MFVEEPNPYDLLAEVVRERHEQSWRRKAACAGSGLLDLFFPEAGDTRHQYTKARAICGSCEVITECREYGLKHWKMPGFWGGLSQQERRQVARERRNARVGTSQ